MADTRRSWIPQFSLRTILIVIAACAVVAFIMGQGQRGGAWAAGLSIGVLGVAVSFVVFAMMFILARLAAAFCENRKIDRGFVELPPPSDRREQVAKLLLLAATLAAALQAGDVWAASGGVVTLPFGTPGPVGTPLTPTPGAKSSGLTITIDTSWVDSGGYRPVRVTVASTTGPVPADRVLTVRFHQKTGYSTHDSAVVTQTIELPMGATTATATLSVPQLGPSGSFEFDTYEDGRYIKELSIPANSGWTSWSGTDQGDAASPVILQLSPIDVSNMMSSRGGVSPETMIVSSTSSGAAQQSIMPPGRFPVRSSVGAPANISTFADLPTRWIDYTGFDLAIVSVNDLKTLIDQHAEQWKAIRNWQRNGGTLIVFDVGDKWQTRSELGTLLKLPAATGRDADSEEAPARLGWTLPLLQDRVPLKFTPDPAQPIPTTQTPPIDAAVVAETPKEIAEEVDSLPRATGSAVKFVTRRDGLGLIVALRANAQLSTSSTNYPWEWILNSIGAQRWQWYERYGDSLSRTNEDFWNFLIPGVGLAPVVSFQLLITAFVIGIGPVNYWLLKRRGALNMLVLTVPISAAAVTATLVTFAFLSDGLSTRVRLRSITQIDQPSGETTCWTRMSYYAGLSPGDGLVFSEDTQVEPLEYNPAASDVGPSRELTWAPADRSDAKSPIVQKLTAGWLVSRTPTQFITSRIRKTKLGLDVDTAKRDSATVKNRLGSKIKWLVLADEKENLFAARDVPDAGTSKLESQETEVGKIMRDMSTVLLENVPLRPDAIGNRPKRTFFGLNQYSRNRYGQASMNLANFPMPSQATSVLETSMSTVREQLQRKLLPPRSYIAIVERGPEVQLGTDVANEEASLHVVTGTW
jgi:hypothetical protein